MGGSPENDSLLDAARRKRNNQHERLFNEKIERISGGTFHRPNSKWERSCGRSNSKVEPCSNYFN